MVSSQRDWPARWSRTATLSVRRGLCLAAIRSTRDRLVATRARGQTSGQQPKFTARQAKVAPGLYDEVGIDGWLAYTVGQIVEEFGRHPPYELPAPATSHRLIPSGFGSGRWTGGVSQHSDLRSTCLKGFHTPRNVRVGRADGSAALR